MKREICIYGIVAIAVLAGCQKLEVDDPTGDVIGGDKDVISFAVNQGNNWKNPETKSGETLRLTTEDGDEMLLESWIIDGIETPEENPETKGAPICASNIGLYNGLLAVKAFWDGSTYIDDVLSLNGGKWKAKKGTYYWPVSDASLDFWAWAPSEVEYGSGSFKNPTISNGQISFDYTLQAHAEETAGSGFYNDAKHQPDLLYVKSLQHRRSDNDSSIKLEFQHALSAVKFQIKTNSEGYVKSVSLLNVNTTGDCVYVPATATESGSFTWKKDGVKLAGTVGTEYTQSFEPANVASGASKVVTNDEDGTVFMMIPQTLGIQKIKIVFHENKYNRDMVFTGTIPGDAWTAGKTYLYTLDYKTFSISVQDTVTGNVKSDLSIKNTGSAPAYIRATIVGYWARTDKNGKTMIVAPWDPNKGSFSGLMGKNWFKSGEYYYYKKVVRSGQEIPDKLFNTYTYTGEAPVAGAKLHILVSAQGVEYDSAKAKVSSAWGSSIADNMNAE